MAKSKKRTKFDNSLLVRAVGEKGNSIDDITLGKLKQKFMSKTLPFPIKYVQIGSKNYYIKYDPTKGFKYEVLS